MADTGVTLQSTNAELLNHIEGMKEKRGELDRFIQKEEEEKARIVNDLRILNERLARVDEGLARKYAARQEYDKTIAETENAFSKIIDSSRTLLHVLKRESTALSKKHVGDSWS
ncbi:13 kDa deflagellation-inducible protein [Diplonema papillatum]|nr:13 kDa deflagellation-inducible protein [Diplonema papillatum]KAJ9457939.1 13 kDa deflagellation-inducible protein [Diplonema papillatum]